MNSVQNTRNSTKMLRDRSKIPIDSLILSKYSLFQSFFRILAISKFFKISHSLTSSGNPSRHHKTRSRKGYHRTNRLHPKLISQPGQLLGVLLRALQPLLELHEPRPHPANAKRVPPVLRLHRGPQGSFWRTSHKVPVWDPHPRHHNRMHVVLAASDGVFELRGSPKHQKSCRRP